MVGPGNLLRSARARVGAAVLVALLAALAAPAPAAAQPEPLPGARAPVPTADFVPYVGSYPVGCTQGNPSPGGVCSNHHSYTGAIDFHMPVGVTIRAGGPGQVVYVNNTCAVGVTSCEGGGGRWVGIRHPDGKVSVYMHLQQAAVTVGQAVQRGTVVGTSGFTGNSLVEHLHYAEQKPIYTRATVGRMYACHGTTFVVYPQVLGHSEWEQVPYGSVVRNDGYACLGTRFLDVPASNPFHDDILWLADRGITGGYQDGTYRPTTPVERQAISAWIHRSAGSPGSNFGDPGLVDVPASHPFRPEIWWMVGTARASGYTDRTFRPAECVTRQAMAAFLYREAGSPPTTVTAAPFPDVPLSHPFVTEVTWMARQGITGGDDAGLFRGGDCVSRQAGAAFLRRAAS